MCAALIPTNYRDLISPHYKGSLWPLLMPLGDCLPSSKTSPKLAAADGPGRLRTRTPRRGEELVWKVVRNAARLLPSGKRCALFSSEGAQRFFGAGLVESVCVRARDGVCVSRVSTTFRPPFYLNIYIYKEAPSAHRQRAPSPGSLGALVGKNNNNRAQSHPSRMINGGGIK